MRSLPLLSLLGVLIAGCGHHGQSHRKVRDLDLELSGRVGRAKQSEILGLMGQPTVRDLMGEAEVWVYQYGTDDRDIDPELKVVAPKHDELILTFDRDGTLQKYTVIIEGRSSQRQRR